MIATKHEAALLKAKEKKDAAGAAETKPGKNGSMRAKLRTMIEKANATGELGDLLKGFVQESVLFDIEGFVLENVKKANVKFAPARHEILSAS